ncbi:MAG: transketolase [Oscillospiraceae bacterium]|nr:transketolase [Oscillospiraceae bacterium]
MNEKELKFLTATADKIRLGIVKSTYAAKSGHPGGSLSITDVLAYLYFYKMNIDPNNASDENRDRFVLSKGHAAPGLYSTLANRGYFDISELEKLRKVDAMLQGHPDMKGTPGVDMSTGSLGQGVSAACGMAYFGKAFNKDYKVYTILGDGECEEGQVWEAAMFAGQKKLSNLRVIVDHNGMQIDGTLAEVNSPEPLDEKFAAFGFNVIKLDDAHDFNKIDAAFTAADEETNRPTAIIMESIKGKGVSFMENQVSWHGKAPNEEQCAIAVKEIEDRLAKEAE